jgi:PadR family transcriptional regulator, regulatory protein AphA
MEYEYIQNGQLSYVECQPESGVITSEADALELVSACGEYMCHRLLIHASNLSPDFYNLRTGLAGAVLLKFSNYHIQAAAVIPTETASQGRFGEFVLETNRGQQFRIFPNRQNAEAWLASL